MTKKDVLEKLKFFDDSTRIRFMFWKTNGTNAFDDNVQISSRFLNKNTGEMYDNNSGTTPLFNNLDDESLETLIYLFSPEQSQDVFNQ